MSYSLPQVVEYVRNQLHTLQSFVGTQRSSELLKSSIEETLRFKQTHKVAQTQSFIKEISKFSLTIKTTAKAIKDGRFVGPLQSVGTYHSTDIQICPTLNEITCTYTLDDDLEDYNITLNRVVRKKMEFFHLNLKRIIQVMDRCDTELAFDNSKQFRSHAMSSFMKTLEIERERQSLIEIDCYPLKDPNDPSVELLDLLFAVINLEHSGSYSGSFIWEYKRYCFAVIKELCGETNENLSLIIDCE